MVPEAQKLVHLCDGGRIYKFLEFIMLPNFLLLSCSFFGSWVIHNKILISNKFFR